METPARRFGGNKPGHLGREGSRRQPTLSCMAYARCRAVVVVVVVVVAVVVVVVGCWLLVVGCWLLLLLLLLLLVVVVVVVVVVVIFKVASSNYILFRTFFLCWLIVLCSSKSSFIGFFAVAPTIKIIKSTRKRTLSLLTFFGLRHQRRRWSNLA